MSVYMGHKLHQQHLRREPDAKLPYSNLVLTLLQGPFARLQLLKKILEDLHIISKAIEQQPHLPRRSELLEAIVNVSC